MVELAACPTCRARVAPADRDPHMEWHREQEQAFAEIVQRLERAGRSLAAVA